jgi:hypothetical protein
VVNDPALFTAYCKEERKRFVVRWQSVRYEYRNGERFVLQSHVHVQSSHKTLFSHPYRSHEEGKGKSKAQAFPFVRLLLFFLFLFWFGLSPCMYVCFFLWASFFLPQLELVEVNWMDGS